MAPILPGGPSYQSGEDPEREKRFNREYAEYAGSPWLTALVQFSGFLLVFVGSFVTVILLINLGSNDEWWPYAFILAVLAAAHAGLRMLRHHRREAGQGRA
jgi:hypothetical protein